MGSGRCICGAVAFEVDGPLRDVLLCHCTECRRWAGHVWAASAALGWRISISRRTADSGGSTAPTALTTRAAASAASAARALFWHAPGREKVSIAAGCLDEPTGIATIAQIWVASAGDYYELDERVPSHEREAE